MVLSMQQRGLLPKLPKSRDSLQSMNLTRSRYENDRLRIYRIKF